LLKWAQTSNNPIDAISAKDTAAMAQGMLQTYGKYKDILAQYQ
jgi:hypothetical protein